MRQIFAWLFPFGPAANSILGTFYISSYVATYKYLSCSQFIWLLGYPTLYSLLYPLRLKATPWTLWPHLLWVIPSCVPSFHSFRFRGQHNDLIFHFPLQTGGLLSDVFLHLVPHSFMGEHQHLGARFVMVEEKRNILIGCVLSPCFKCKSKWRSLVFTSTLNRLGMFIGFATFFFMEKTLRVLGGEDEGSEHSHTYAHKTDHSPIEAKTAALEAETTALETSTSRNGLRLRRDDPAIEGEAQVFPEPVSKSSGPSKLSAYLNLFGDFVHNMWVLA